MPKSIVVANIAGEHIMLYEDGYSLIYQFINMVTAPAQRKSVRVGIDSMTKFADDMMKSGLLLVYSMPPLEDFSTMHWELRSVTVNGENVLDGARHFYRNSLEPCFGSPTGYTTEPEILRAETVALQNHCTAVLVDVRETPTTDTSCASVQNTSTRETVLRNTIAALQSDRKQIVSDINAMKAERVDNMERERILARADVEKEIEAARVSRRLADKLTSDARIEIATLRKELEWTSAQLQESKSEITRMELIHSQEDEALKQSIAYQDKEKRDLRANKHRMEKQAMETLRSVKADYDNLKFDSDDRIKTLNAQVEEFKRREQMNKEMHDKVVTCMAGQDAEIDVLKAKVAECTAEMCNRDEAVARLQREVASGKKSIAALKTDMESDREKHDTSETLAIVVRLSGAVTEVQNNLLEAQRENSVLQERLQAATLLTTCSHEAQTVMTDMVTTGTDTYIDTVQRSKTTQTDVENESTEPLNVVDALKSTFKAFEQLVDVAQLPRSGYLMQSGVHPPARRCKLVSQPTR
jgi:hypothetical protein